jgi:hypothetical protein
MLAATFVLSFVAVCGFYAYFVVQLARGHKRMSAHGKCLAEHFYGMGPEPDKDAAEDSSDPDLLRGASISSKAGPHASTGRETWIQLSLAVGGLAALFAGIELLNSLVTWLDWC